MKVLAISLLTLLLAIGLLRTDLTPWRLLSKQEIEAIKHQHLASEAAMRRRLPQPTPWPTISDGSWMRDPNYRSALERTTVAGRVEPAAPRDQPFRQPTPKPH